MTASSQTVTPTYPGKAPGEFRNRDAFAAIKTDGSVVTWGIGNSGGDSSAVADELNAEGTPAVTQVVSNRSAFAALREDGSVVTWGEGVYEPTSFGGYSSEVAYELDADGSPEVTKIFSTTSAFAALREDGSVVTWGDAEHGGNSDSVANQIDADGSPEVTEIFSTALAFTALREDGSIITWGDNGYSGESDSFLDQIGELDADDSPAVTEIFSTGSAFAALREDGSVFTWGSALRGGASESFVNDLDLPFTHKWCPASRDLLRSFHCSASSFSW